MAEPEIRYCVTADGVSIAYYAMGEGETLLLSSTVLWSSVRHSSTFLPEHQRVGVGVGRGMRVVRYDGRGAGMSDRSALDFSLEARIRDIDAVVAKLGLETFALLGITHGCLGAVEYAAHNPEKVTRLVLSNPIINGPDTRRRMRRWDSLREMASEEWEDYTLTMAAANVGYDQPELIRALAQRMRESMSPAAVQASFEALGDIDVTASLPRLKMPTLVMQRDLFSRVVTGEDVQAIAAAIPDAQLVQTKLEPGTFWSQADADAIERFLGVAPEPAVALAEAESASVSQMPEAGALRMILFTDLVGHTEMMQRLGDARGRDVLREHERITRDLLRQHGGDEVKTMGDGFMASFGSVTRAMDCAVALQRGFAARKGEPLEIRVGLNAGEPIEEDGDLFGATVILASRIAAKAGAGEILIPEPVRHLLTGKSYVYADRGETMLKGFEDAVRLYEVRWRE